MFRQNRPKKIFILLLSIAIILSTYFLLFIKNNEASKIAFSSIESVDWPYNVVDFVKLNNSHKEHLKIAIIDTDINTSASCLKGIHLSTYTMNNVRKVPTDVHGTIIADIIYNSNFLDSPQDSLRKNIEFFGINVGNDDNIKIDSLTKGIQKAISLNADILNISLGVYLDNPNLRSAINNALSKNIIIVCSAGNDSTKQDMFPACYKGVISVTSVDMNNNYLLNNNENSNITLSAPGEKIPTNVLVNGKSIYMYGTSASTALVTSAIIVFKNNNIKLKPKYIIDIFKNTSKNIGDRNIYGYGLLDYKEALLKINQYK